MAATAAASGSVEARAALARTLPVVPKVPTTADAAMLVTGTLKLLTNDPRNPELRIPLTDLARGATLSFPASVDFGDIPLSASSPPVPIAFKNLGSAPVPRLRPYRGRLSPRSRARGLSVIPILAEPVVGRDRLRVREASTTPTGMYPVFTPHDPSHDRAHDPDPPPSKRIRGRRCTLPNR